MHDQEGVMSDTAINIRILFWHIQLTTYGKWRFGLNRWVLKYGKAKVLLKPIWIYEFNLSKRNTESLCVSKKND